MTADPVSARSARPQGLDGLGQLPVAIRLGKNGNAAVFERGILRMIRNAGGQQDLDPAVQLDDLLRKVAAVIGALQAVLESCGEMSPDMRKRQG